MDGTPLMLNSKHNKQLEGLTAGKEARKSQTNPKQNPEKHRRVRL